MTLSTNRLVSMVSDVVAAYVSNNQVPREELPTLIKSVHDSLALVSNNEKTAERQEPAVPINDSVKDDYLICLEDGAKLKMLKRYLRTHYELTPEEYRAKWGLPNTYPMVAPSYAAKRSEFAKKSGLGKGKRSKK